MADTQTTAETQTAQVPADLTAEQMMKDNLLMLGMLFFIFYFLLIRPQQKRLKLHQNMMKSLAKGNRVITTGGLIGTVVKFEGEDVVVVEISPNVKVRLAKSAISEIMESKESSESANDN